MHQAQNAQQMQGLFQRPRFFIPEGRVLMRNEGADSYHMGAQLFHIQKVFHDVVCRLSRCSQHDSAADLIADLLQVAQASFPVLNGQFRRMQHPVMGRIGGLVPQQVAVGTGVKICLIALSGLLSDRQGNGTVRMLFLDAADQPADLLVREERILPALQDNGPEAQPVPPVRAVQDLFFCQPVPVRAAVGPADPAVIAVIAAPVGEFNQSAQIDCLSVDRFPHFSGAGVQQFFLIRRQFADQGTQICRRQSPVFFQL